MSSVTHFEIYASEPGKLADFYRALFGWQLEKAPGIDYWRIQTEPSHTNSFNGGLTYRPIPEPRSWVHYVNVESLDAAIEQLQRLGGSVLRPKTAVPKTAWYAVVQDPEGNILLILGSLTRRRFRHPNQIEERGDGPKTGGRLFHCWNTLFIKAHVKTRTTKSNT